jgi:large subunit ribosomal protein L13
MNSTVSTKSKDIQRAWHHVDVKDQTLGRVASEIAQILMGKSKPYFVRNLDCGDYVVVTNAASVKVTGKKEVEKVYYRHSMYPGGLRAARLEEVRAQKPEEIIMHAVKGMLPQNKLRASMLKRLYVFKGENHTYESKFTTAI